MMEGPLIRYGNSDSSCRGHETGQRIIPKFAFSKAILIDTNGS